jgi:hypothetical protein
MIWRFVAAIYQWLRSLFGRQPTPSVGPDDRYVRIARFDRVATDPPRMHWAPCHPSVLKRFKASMTCPNGHGLTLGGHTVAADGIVHPSVVCPTAGCSFHEFVKLDRWSFGEVR